MKRAVYSLVLLALFVNYSFAVICSHFCGLNSSKCLANGRCLCYWGFTGPNAVYVTSSGGKNRKIVADFCTISCQYNHLYSNPKCGKIPTTAPSTTMYMTTPMAPAAAQCSVPTTQGQASGCHPKCGQAVYRGKCLSNGRCLCWWGWTGPNSCYVNGGVYNNRILADFCGKACHYTHDYRNARCATFKAMTTSTAPSSTPGVASTTPHTGSTASSTQPTKVQKQCDPRCTRFGQGTCRPDGLCLCWWGWTGPNATYITTGSLTNRIEALYCNEPCHYTHDHVNASCARIPVPKTCSVPSNSTPSIPCDKQCGAGVYHGKCLSDGRCLCWWGWTGPEACYVDGGTYNNRIIADYCNDACHYTHDHRNESCVKKTAPELSTPASTGQATSVPSTANSMPFTVQPTSEETTSTASTIAQTSTAAPRGSSTEGRTSTRETATSSINTEATSRQPSTATQPPPEPTEPLEPTEPTEPPVLGIFEQKHFADSGEERKLAGGEPAVPQDSSVEGAASHKKKGESPKRISYGVVSLGVIACVLGVAVIAWWAHKYRTRASGYRPVDDDTAYLMGEMGSQ
ncbi:protein draper isoform X2 [Nematostella vectensis]|uniref:protein draper isoform X2 n=1 Tax=Nematostella vectensis TaxID=45351 RepID=UPI00138FB4F8|nr:protein draper isoform X2 [Nematostella vectensis]